MSRKNEFTEMVDKSVGAEIHNLRIIKGLSRTQLANKIGITQQQLNKNESGINRLSIGRLILIAEALDKPVSYFLNDIGIPISTHNQADRMHMELNRNYAKLKPAVKISVGNHVRTLAQNS